MPVFVSRLYGADRFTAVYGRIFTAWGLAGIFAPWLAGKLFDTTGGYTAALVFSAVSLVIAGLTAVALPRDER